MGSNLPFRSSPAEGWNPSNYDNSVDFVGSTNAPNMVLATALSSQNENRYWDNMTWITPDTMQPDSTRPNQFRESCQLQGILPSFSNLSLNTEHCNSPIYQNPLHYNFAFYNNHNQKYNNFQQYHQTSVNQNPDSMNGYHYQRMDQQQVSSPLAHISTSAFYGAASSSKQISGSVGAVEAWQRVYGRVPATSNCYNIQPVQSEAALGPSFVSSTTNGTASPPGMLGRVMRVVTSRKKVVRRMKVDRVDKRTVSHPCPQCGKGFKNKSNIALHLRTHTGERPFRCMICQMRFRQKAHLQKHSAIHQK